MIRVVSWNIELGQNLDQAIEELTSLDGLRDADIVLLQEMDPAGTAKVAAALDMDSRYGAPADHPKTGLPFGNAVLSRWPMSGPVQLDLPHTARVMPQARAAVGTTVVVDNLHLDVFSVHLETVLLGLTARVEQVETIARHLDANEPRPTIVGGDFNAASRRSLRAFDRALRPSRFERLSSASTPTFGRFGRPFALDHLYGRHIHVVSSGVSTDAEASDHRPTWAVVNPR